MSQADYKLSVKQKAINNLFKEVSKCIDLVEADNKRQIADLIRVCFKHGVAVPEIVAACKLSRTQVYNIKNNKSLSKAK